jgi:hypothetical protein
MNCCSKCWKEIALQSAKKSIKFDIEYYSYKQVIYDLENPELEK